MYTYEYTYTNSYSSYTYIHRYSLLHLEYLSFNLESQSIISFSRSLLPRSVEKRPMRLRLEIDCKCDSKCNGLYLHSKEYAHS